MKNTTRNTLLASFVLLTSAAQATNRYIYNETYLKARPAILNAEDLTGRSVAIDGDIMVVGAYKEDSPATGVDTPTFANALTNGDTDAGAAYVFERAADGSWAMTAYLKADNTDAGDQFGHTVAISGNTIVVGAPYEDSGQTSVGNNANIFIPHTPSADNSATSRGAAYVFTRNASTGTWSQQAYLKAPDTTWLGFEAIAIDGNRVVIGGRNQAVIFQRTRQTVNLPTPFSYYTWAHEQTLSAGDPSDKFGEALAIDGNTLVVGARQESSDGSDPADNSLIDSGAAYVYFHDGSSWQQQAYLKALNLDAEDGFGASVALAGDNLAIGAPKEDSIGINAENNSMQDAGAVYLFQRLGSGSSASWVANPDSPYLKAPNPYYRYHFGQSVALDKQTLVVGAPDEGGDGTSAHHNYGVFGLDKRNSGAIYVFSQAVNKNTGLREGAWLNMAYLKSPQIDADDKFGHAVDISADRIAIGVVGEDSDGSTAANNDLSNSGAAYLYNFEDEILFFPPGGFLVGGAVIGLPSNTSIRLQNRQADDSTSTITAFANYRRFRFSTPVTDTYDVSVVSSSLPDGFTCRVENGNGNVNSGEVFNIWVVCYQPLISDSFEAP